MTKYTIGDISRKLNVSNDAVRYYDKEGLLPFAKRNKAGRREFTRLDFMKTHEEQLEEKIKVLEMNLAFLRWKIWYYQTAAEAGTESIHFIPGTTQVKPEIRDIFK